MKVYAVNASPRKGWNTDQMLNSFIRGVREAAPEIEVEKVNLYDMDFKGCRSCFACQMKHTENGQCLFRDEAYELIRGIKSGDGFAFAAPIYYFEVPAQLRAVFERLFYPGKAAREIPVAAIYTMNQPQENMEKYFKRHIDDIAFFLRDVFNTEPEQVFAYNTLHWKNPEKYHFPEEWYAEKVKYHNAHFQNDLQSAHEAGIRFADRVKQRAVHCETRSASKRLGSANAK